MMHLMDFASSDILTSMKATSMYMTTTFVNQYATYILAGAILCAVIGFCTGKKALMYGNSCKTRTKGIVLCEKNT